MSDGVLYIATGRKFIRAAMHSATSVRRHCPGLPIHPHADWQRHGFDFATSPYPFTSVETIERPHRRSKVDLMARTPFARTLFLDADTEVNEDVRGLFQVLDRFDLALTHAHLRNAAVRLRPWRIEYFWSSAEATSKILHHRRYHDGPFWFLRTWAKTLWRPLVRLGIDPRTWLRTQAK